MMKISVISLTTLLFTLTASDDALSNEKQKIIMPEENFSPVKIDYGDDVRGGRHSCTFHAAPRMGEKGNLNLFVTAGRKSILSMTFDILDVDGNVISSQKTKLGFLPPLYGKFISVKLNKKISANDKDPFSKQAVSSLRVVIHKLQVK